LPKIQFANLPRPVRQHLLQRVDERRISVADLLALQEWVKTDPVAPAGDWYKDFGSFILWHRPVSEDGAGEGNEAVRESGRLIADRIGTRLVQS
jgi:hypothetical protein